MILKQYYVALAAMMTGLSMQMTSHGGVTETVTGSGGQKVLQLHNGMRSVASSTAVSGVLFGSDDTPVSHTDDSLKALISGLTGSCSVTSTYDAENGLVTVSSIITVTNGGNTDVTIKEVGLNINWSGNWSFLMDRTVLDEPITIPAGGVGQVTYTIRMNYPTA